MDQNCKAVVEKRIQRTMESLQKNNMQAYYAATKEDAVAQVAGLLKPELALAKKYDLPCETPEDLAAIREKYMPEMKRLLKTDFIHGRSLKNCPFPQRIKKL